MGEDDDLDVQFFRSAEMSDLDKMAQELKAMVLRDSAWGTVDPEERARIALDAEVEGDLLTGLTFPRDMMTIAKIDLRPIEGDYTKYDDGRSARNSRVSRKAKRQAK